MMIVETTKKRDFEKAFSRMEELITAVGAIPDDKTRELTQELARTLLELHGAALNRALEIVFDEQGAALIDKLAADEMVSNLLVLHGLHPLDLETRVRNALESVKPRLGLHGGSVQLVGVTPEGAVRLQLEGNCEGCPSSRLTLKFSIEEAIYAAAPDVTALEVNGLVEEHAAPIPSPKFVECPEPLRNGQTTGAHV
jgi:Fe-S cluster biogenesis protein NfuA